VLAPPCLLSQTAKGVTRVLVSAKAEAVAGQVLRSEEFTFQLTTYIYFLKEDCYV